MVYDGLVVSVLLLDLFAMFWLLATVGCCFADWSFGGYFCDFD